MKLIWKMWPGGYNTQMSKWIKKKIMIQTIKLKYDINLSWQLQCMQMQQRVTPSNTFFKFIFFIFLA